jgi:hypothetical protein
MLNGTPKKRHNTPKFGTPILARFGSENVHPNTPGEKNVVVESAKKKTPLRRASSSNSLFGTPGSKTPSGSLPLIEGGFSSKRKSLKKYERPFSSPEGSKRSLLSGLETTEHYGLQDNDISCRINLLGIKDLNANSAETDFLDTKTDFSGNVDKAVTPIPCKPKQSRRQGSFAILNTCSPDVDDTFSPVTKQMYARDKDANKPLKGAMKKTNIQRVIAERRKLSLGEDFGIEPKHEKKNCSSKVHTPRQLPSLLPEDKKKKFSSPTDLFMSPVSRNFHTVGDDGKFRKGNVRKLIALKSGTVPHGKENSGSVTSIHHRKLGTLLEGGSSLRNINSCSSSKTIANKNLKK